MHRLRTVLPSANYLFTFEAAARRLSFTDAAQELNVSQPAVSKTIRLLEEAVGFRLFRRAHNRLELTAEGVRLHREVRDSLDHLYATIHSLRQNRTGEVVRVSFSASFVQFWLLPRLADFRARHPEVALRIEESPRDDHDLAREEIDLSARLGDGHWPGLDAWPLIDEVIIPVCSPDYLRAHGPIRSPADLPGHALLDFEERYRDRLRWRGWLDLHGVPTGALHRDFVFTDALGSIKAAALGQGIALGWVHLVHDQIEAGQLVRALPDTYRSGAVIHLTMPADRPPEPGAELFRDWLLARMAEVAVQYPPDQSSFIRPSPKA